MAKASEDPKLAKLMKICLALPEVTRETSGDHACFKVRKKSIAYYLVNHHGDGIVALACKVMAGDNKTLAAADPARFYIPPYLGANGWVALRLDRGEIDWEEVAELILGSYLLIAPKRLADLARPEA